MDWVGWDGMGWGGSGCTMSCSVVRGDAMGCGGVEWDGKRAFTSGSDVSDARRCQRNFASLFEMVLFALCFSLVVCSVVSGAIESTLCMTPGRRMLNDDTGFEAARISA